MPSIGLSTFLGPDAPELSAAPALLHTQLMSEFGRMKVGEEHEFNLRSQSMLEFFSPRYLNFKYANAFYSPLFWGIPGSDLNMGEFYKSGMIPGWRYQKPEEVRFKSSHLTPEENDNPALYKQRVAELEQEQRQRLTVRLGAEQEAIDQVTLQDPIGRALGELALTAHTAFNRHRLQNEMTAVRELRDIVSQMVEEKDFSDGRMQQLRDFATRSQAEGLDLLSMLEDLFLDPYEVMDGFTPQQRGAYDHLPADKKQRNAEILQGVPYHWRVVEPKTGNRETDPKLIEAFFDNKLELFIDQFISDDSLTRSGKRERYFTLGASIDQPDDANRFFIEFLAAKLEDRFAVNDVLRHRAMVVHRADMRYEEIAAIMDSDEPDFSRANSRIFDGRSPQEVAQLYATQANELARLLKLQHCMLTQDEIDNLSPVDARYAMEALTREVNLKMLHTEVPEAVQRQATVIIENLRQGFASPDQWRPVEIAQWERMQRKAEIYQLQNYKEALDIISVEISGFNPSVQQQIWDMLNQEMIRFQEQRHYLYGESADIKGPHIDHIFERITSRRDSNDPQLFEALRQFVVHNSYVVSDLLAIDMHDALEDFYSNVLRPAYAELYGPAEAAALPRDLIINIQYEGTGPEGTREMVLRPLPPQLAQVIDRAKRYMLTGHSYEVTDGTRSDALKLYGPDGTAKSLDVSSLPQLWQKYSELSPNLRTGGNTYTMSTHSHMGFDVLLNVSGRQAYFNALTERTPEELVQQGGAKYRVSEFGEYVAIALSKLAPEMRAAFGNLQDDIERLVLSIAAPQYAEMANIDPEDPNYYAKVRMGSSIAFVNLEDNSHLEQRASGASTDPRLREIYEIVAMQHAVENYIVDKILQRQDSAMTPDARMELLEVMLLEGKIRYNTETVDPILEAFNQQDAATRQAFADRVMKHLQQGVIVPREFASILDAFYEVGREGGTPMRQDTQNPERLYYINPFANPDQSPADHLRDHIAQTGGRGPKIVNDEERGILSHIQEHTAQVALRDDAGKAREAEQAINGVIRGVAEQRLADFATAANRYADQTFDLHAAG